MIPLSFDVMSKIKGGKVDIATFPPFTCTTLT